MSQQFEEMERGYQAQPPYPSGNERGYGPGPGFDDALSGLSGQKLGQQYTSSSASAGQRLALAIVSICLLVPLTAITLGISSSSSIGLIGGLIVLSMICLTIMIVNVVFNIRH
jgi:hypothetical protein